MGANPLAPCSQPVYRIRTGENHGYYAGFIPVDGVYAALGLGELPEGAELHPVPSPNLDTQIKKVAVSFSQHKLDMIDRKAKASGMTRSGFLAAAASAYEDQPHV